MNTRITNRDYARKLISFQRSISELFVDVQEGADMKEVNDKLVTVSQAAYEFSLRYRGQEEGANA